MAFYRNLFLAIAAVLGLLYFLTWYQKQPGAAPAAPAVAVAAPAAVAPVSTEPEYRPGTTPPGFAGAHPMAPTPAPPVVVAPVAARRQQAAPVSRVAQPGASQGHRAAVEAAARKAGVKIVSYSESGAVTVKIQWVSSSEGPGGDFLDNCISAGMRDFDDLGKNFGSDRNGRQVWSGSYRLKF